ncbi:alkaline shock response membrane anchor protein AmaP [Streptococcus saliviloxodontae]|uniref:Alkaline shock response membrane anchor protein AmaP n=1 Tax=Streptococcus saliviloxodontae TaxID=1349416 RepID=A0ABS2PJ21_9STRE|nr:alkaline shock response membrane anchor protein AmaP [Streptococcus saliviloxodontae]MBM7635433.1 hypothetical protein [Streptococcus saliviloxodontae]
MTKLSKTLSVILGLILISFLLSVSYMYLDQASVPKDIADQLASLKFDYSFGQDVLSDILGNYFFWGPIIIVVFIVIALILIIFWPRTYSELTLDKSNSGSLKLKKSAIEGYVKSIVVGQGVMASPKVDVKMYRKKFKVSVSGRMIPRINAIEKSIQLEQDIHHGLEQFFGIDKLVDFTVLVKHIEEKEKTTSSRVE